MARPIGTGRTILSVVGPHSGCGKTLFVTRVLRAIPGLGTLKISPAQDWRDEAVEGAALVGQDFYLEGSAGLADPGKDTTLYLEAGAAVVSRLRHGGEGLAAGLEAALEQCPSTTPVLIESSSAVRLLEPAAVILIVRPPMREMKPTTEAILPRVTDLLINASASARPGIAEADRLQRQFPTLRPQFTWTVDLAGEPLPSGLLARLRVLLEHA